MPKNKTLISPNTTLYPVPVVMISCGHGKDANIFTLNRISSCNAEPPMLAISIRPGRASNQLIASSGEFVVNFPPASMEVVTDFIGTTTAREINKWELSGLRKLEAAYVKPSMIADCPVNIECQVVQSLPLPSHIMYLAEVLAIHADQNILTSNNEVDFQKVGGGLVYRSAVVRERPVEKFDPADLLSRVHAWRNQAPD